MTTITERARLEELLAQYWEIAFEESSGVTPTGNKANSVLYEIRALFDALAAPATAPESVAWLRAGAGMYCGYQTCEVGDENGFPVYRHPPATAPEQPMSKALQDVAAERQRQDAKWGGPEHDDTHTISDWQRFISQRAENLAYRGNPERMRELFVEIAALAVAAAESIDRKGTP